MAVSLWQSDTTTPTVGVENVLATGDLPDEYVFEIDTINMAAGDVLEVRVYEKILAGGTARVIYFTRYAGVQPTDDQIKVSPRVRNDLNEIGATKFTITQTHGTARAYAWKLLKLR
jgi:hypothetical protein